MTYYKEIVRKPVNPTLAGQSRSPITKDVVIRYLKEDIHPLEDDVGEEEFSAFNAGAPGTAKTTEAKVKQYAGYAKTGMQQGISRTGNVATAANLGVLGAASSGVAGALAPVIAVTGPIGYAFSLVDAGLSGYSAYKTSKHIRNLEVIMMDLGVYAHEGTIESIAFCIKKKNKKLRRKAFGAVPVLGTIGNSVYSYGNALYKKSQGTRGVQRRQRASELWANAVAGDRCAIAACKELLGLKIYNLIEGMHDGHLVLKKKLRSI